MTHRCWRSWLVVLLLFLSLLCPPIAAFPSPTRPKVILFVMDGVDYRTVLPQGFSAFGEIGALLERRGSMALLNTMGYGGADRFRAAMSIVCGVRAFGDATAGHVLAADEPYESDTALDAYRRRVGNNTVPQVSPPFRPLVFPMLAELQWLNERMQKKPLPFGIVAQSLRSKGVRIIGISSADVPVQGVRVFPLPSLFFRHGLLLALDEHGLGMGLTGTTLLHKDPAMPFGVAVDPQKWRQIVEAAWQQADVLVLFPGETLRADLYGSERLVPLALRRELQLLQPILERMDKQRDLLLVFSLAPSARSRYTLSWAVGIGKGMVPDGLLTSTTTQQKGLISILDIPATVLDFWQVIPTHSINGAPIRSEAFTRPINRLQWLWGMGEAARITDSWWRFAFLVSWCVAQSLLFAAIALLLCVWQAAPNPAAQRWGQRLTLVLLVLVTATIGVHLLSAGFNQWLQGKGEALATTVLLFMALIGFGIFAPSDRYLWSLVFFACVLFACDGLFRGLFSPNAPFGYSFFFGGRYYGLGNVGMGLTLGAFLAMGLWEPSRRWVAALLVAFGTMVVGAPFFGANIGGALTGVVTLLAILGAGRWRWWHGLVAIALLSVFLGGFALVELLRPEPLTHWGRLVHAIHQEGVGWLLAMVWTKLGITFRAFRGIHWGVALAAQLMLLAALWLKGERDWQWKAVLMGSIAALLLNDSGPQTPVAFAFFPLCVLTMRLFARLGCLPS